MSALLGQGQPHSLQTSNSGSVWRSDRQLSTNESPVFGAAARRSLKSALSGWGTLNLTTPDREARCCLPGTLVGWWWCPSSLPISFQCNLHMNNGEHSLQRKYKFLKITVETIYVPKPQKFITVWSPIMNNECSACSPTLQKLVKFMEQLLHLVTGT